MEAWRKLLVKMAALVARFDWDGSLLVPGSALLLDLCGVISALVTELVLSLFISEGMQFYYMMDLGLNTMWLSFRLASTLLLLIVKASDYSWTTSSENFSTGSKSFTVILFSRATFESSKSEEDCFWFSHEAASLSVHLSGDHSPASCCGFGRCGSKS